MSNPNRGAERRQWGSAELLEREAARRAQPAAPAPDPIPPPAGALPTAEPAQAPPPANLDEQRARALVMSRWHVFTPGELMMPPS